MTFTFLPIYIVLLALGLIEWHNGNDDYSMTIGAVIVALVAVASSCVQLESISQELGSEEDEMTVFSPEAVQIMCAKGTFREILLKDMHTTDHDEAFYFRFPSPSVFNDANGDGDWLEIVDYRKDLSGVWTDAGFIDCPEKGLTKVYIR